MATSPRANRDGLVGPYGVRYSWLYWALTAAAFALLVVDLLDDGAQWANLGVIVLIAVAVVIRPGGLRGPRHAARAAADARPPADD